MTVREWLDEYDGDVLVADGFDDAILGITESWESHSSGGAERVTRVVYDADACIQILRECGMTQTEAEEYFAFNVDGAYVGPQTPIYVTRPPRARE